MKLLFSTENGSNYLLDKKAMTWERIVKTGKSGEIRKEHGEMLDWPMVEVGYPVLIFDTTKAIGCKAHGVFTSKVVEIREVGDS